MLKSLCPFMLTLLICAPLIAGNSVTIRVSFTIPERIEIKKEESIQESKQQESQTCVQTAKVEREGRKFILRTVTPK